jgi:hypothetical protein
MQRPELDLDEAERVLRSFQEWMVQHATQPTPHSNAKGSSRDRVSEQSEKSPYVSPNVTPSDVWSGSPRLAPPSTPFDTPGEPVEEVGNPKPSLRSRLFRTLIRGFLVAIVAAVAWQVYQNDDAKQRITALANSSSMWFWRSLHTGSHTSSTVPDHSKSSDRAVVADNPSTPMPTPSQEYRDIQQQLQVISNQLNALGHDVEIIAGNQDRITRDLATVQAAQQNAGQKIATLAKAIAVRPSSRKNDDRTVRSETQHPAIAPLPPPSPPVQTEAPRQ